MTVKLVVDGSDLADCLSQLPLTTTPSAPPVEPPAKDPFPPDPADAPFPSPDYSSIQWDALPAPGAPVGPPYLRDDTGKIWTLPPASGPRNAVLINGSMRGTGAAVTQIIVAGSPAQVYHMLVTGQVQRFNSNNSVDNNLTLPPRQGTAPPPAPVVPPDPPHAPSAPGSGKTILCGPSQPAIKTLALAISVASPGDTIMLEAGVVFAESVVIPLPVVIDGQGDVGGVGRAVLDGSTFKNYALGKGGLVVHADAIIRRMEIRDFGLQEAASGGTSGIRVDAPCWVGIEDCHIHDCQDGVAGTAAAVVTMRNTLLEGCGLPDGHSHNIYLEVNRLVLDGVESRNTRIGHCVKFRGAVFIATTTTFGPCQFGSCLDLPSGTTVPATADHCTFLKDPDAAPPATPDHHVIGYGEEDGRYGITGVLVTASALDLRCTSPFAAMPRGGTITLTPDCTKTGSPLVSKGTGVVAGA